MTARGSCPRAAPFGARVFARLAIAGLFVVIGPDATGLAQTKPTALLLDREHLDDVRTRISASARRPEDERLGKALAALEEDAAGRWR